MIAEMFADLRAELENMAMQRDDAVRALELAKKRGAFEMRDWLVKKLRCPEPCPSQQSCLHCDAAALVNQSAMPWTEAEEGRDSLSHPGDGEVMP